MSDLPAPLVPAYVDLRDFAFMPLDVRRLRDSRIAASTSGEEFRAALLLWCAAWHQQPAGSLPDDDVELATLAGYGRVIKEWKRVRAGALYGCVRCSDGRLYHPVVAEKANESWHSKMEHAYRKEVDRLRKENKKLEGQKLPALGIPTFEDWNSAQHVNGIPAESSELSDGNPAENPLKGEVRDRELKGQGDIKSKASTAGAAAVDSVKDEIWKTGRQMLEGEGKTKEAAGSLLGKLCKDYGQVLVLAAVRDAVAATPAKPSEWLIARCQERREKSGNGGLKWSASNAGIDAKGKELGMPARGGESYRDYAARLNAALQERQHG